jgi:hypothetical protein
MCCTAYVFNSARRICSRFWTIIPGCCRATGGVMRRTPFGWPWRCARRWPPAGYRARHMSITVHRSSTGGCCEPARNSVCAWFIPHQVGPWVNGYIESFNNRLRKECLNRNHWNSLFEARVVIGDFKAEHNEPAPLGAGLPHAGRARWPAGAPTPRWPARSTESGSNNPTLKPGGLRRGLATPTR